MEGRKGSCGRLIPTYEARLVQEDGSDAPEGGRGELWVRGPSVMTRGYHRNPEATAKTMNGDWFMTGDVAVRDPEGWYTIVDRVKELIKYKGFQVPPAELEALLLTHPDVVDAGVVGVWVEEQATELPRAYIVARPGLIPEQGREEARSKFGKEIAAWVAGRVAQHKKLRGGVKVIDAIPKSPSGKILRKDLRVVAQEEIKREGLGARAKL
ncbi:AMP binding protein [Trichosporon asahii var. asahii CBS 8904]|uniref:AMP binding protein n=1 Tax=Trichosporon asahii var. asahii (strain CBS 8904) TaxID=1220162 RepID=K1VWQ8_TRIAC|nr:AMP binding protein [Trichosporon asahii var. asahii CBS 8904]